MERGLPQRTNHRRPRGETGLMELAVTCIDGQVVSGSAYGATQLSVCDECLLTSTCVVLWIWGVTLQSTQCMHTCEGQQELIAMAQCAALDYLDATR